MKKNKILTEIVLLVCAVVLCAADVEYESGTYQNIQRPILYNITDGTDRLINPAHHMSEGVTIDHSRIYQTSFGVYLQSGAVRYYAQFDYIPVPPRLWNESNGMCIDYSYRGKILMFGEEYYVSEIDTPGFIEAYKATILTNVSNRSFSPAAYGYYFKNEEILEKCTDTYCWVAGANVTVRRPGGQELLISLWDTQDAYVDNLRVSLMDVGYTTGMESINSSIIVYNTAEGVRLENGYNIYVNDVPKTGWTVAVSTVAQPFGAGMDIDEYKGISAGQYLIANATVTYTQSVILNMSTVLTLPGAYKVISNGTNVEVANLYDTTTTTTTTTSTTTTSTTLSECELRGDKPPCGNVSLGEVIDLINEWANGNASLGDVVTLINAWATGT